MGINISKYFERIKIAYHNLINSEFFKGMGSLTIFPHNNYKPSWMNNKLTPAQQDYLAIKGNWKTVGKI